ncbi:hypothetical protein H4Q26_003842 [Puccinia striiformis f. sp. tritici PST-130]|nr:hypothetical protein H4Q26_003842 [Puccinia striiformis f. sp. tritici PST-130]
MIMEEHGADSPLNQAIEGFTDENGQVTQEFIAKLNDLNSVNSKGDLCIAEYLVAAEKAYFKHVRDDKLAVAKSQFDGSTLRGSDKRPISRANSEWSVKKHAMENDEDDEESANGSDEPLTTPASLNQWQIRLQKVYFGWPVYTILLAFGQVLGATSFQLSLLGGSSSQRTFDLYIIGAVNIIGSVTWYILNSVKPATWSLSLPWVCFGMAFLLIGFPSLSPSLKIYGVRHPLSLLASSFYSFASAAGFLFFSTNFGEEAGGGTDTWVYRACVVQGTQQIWIAALWYWGFKLQGTNPTDTASVPPAWINAITFTLAITCFGIGYVLFIGLPNYYRNVPGQVPNFVKTLFRRKLVIWYMAAEILRDYWLSGPYGRNWSFLWTGSGMHVWATVILVFIFFVGVWAVVMKGLSHASKKHTWFLPIFAVGLGAPRWCQMLWGTSSLATYLPWAGSAGPYLGTTIQALNSFFDFLNSIQDEKNLRLKSPNWQSKCFSGVLITIRHLSYLFDLHVTRNYNHWHSTKLSDYCLSCATQKRLGTFQDPVVRKTVDFPREATSCDDLVLNGDHKTTISESINSMIKDQQQRSLRLQKLPKSQLSGETKYINSSSKKLSRKSVPVLSPSHKAANRHKFFRRTRSSSPSPKKCDLKKKDIHPITSNKDEHTTPDLPRGVCLRESEADLDSSSIPGKDTMAEVIEVSKVLTMRLTGTPSGAVNLVTGLSLGDVLGAVGQSTEFYDALAIGSKKLIDMSEAHSELIGMVPKDRISIWCYWWGYEIAIPLESVDRLTNVKSIETAAIQILVALTAAGGAVELLPFIRFLGAYLDVEWAAITEQNKGKESLSQPLGLFLWLSFRALGTSILLSSLQRRPSRMIPLKSSKFWLFLVNPPSDTFSTFPVFSFAGCFLSFYQGDNIKFLDSF